MEDLTVADLQAFLQDRYGVSELQSVTYGDLMLYADFMGDVDYLEGLSIAQLILRASDTSRSDEGEDTESTPSLNDARDYSDIYGSDVMSEVGEGEEGAKDPASLVLNSLLEKRFIDLEVSCIDEDGNDMHLPPVRVRCSDTPSSSRRSSGSSKGPFNLIDMLPKELRAILKALGKYKPALLKLIRSILS